VGDTGEKRKDAEIIKEAQELFSRARYYHDLAAQDRPDWNLGTANDYYRQAAKTGVQNVDPLFYAEIKNSQGDALYQQAMLSRNVGLLFESLDVYSAAGEWLRMDQHWPLPLSVATQTDSTLIAACAENLRRTLATCREYVIRNAGKKEPFPHQALGRGYYTLSQYEDECENLHSAIQAFRSYQQLAGPGLSAEDEAMLCRQLGHLHGRLATFEDQTGNLRQAVEAFEQAIKLWIGGAVVYAQVERELANIYRTRASYEDTLPSLIRAIVLLMDALQLYRNHPKEIERIEIKLDLGIVFSDLGDFSAATACWREPEAYFRQKGNIEKADELMQWINEAMSKVVTSNTRFYRGIHQTIERW
jgi:tetratricopeptide (TPR) repeat protein